MDLQAWRIAVTQWVNQCGFIEANFISLKQSNIEKFYEAYSHHVELFGERMALVNEKSKTPLHIFLGTFYPGFTVLVDGYGRILEDDYVYVYTLLLHYACVLRPTPFFQHICTKLQDAIQESIMAFCQQTVGDTKITRDYLYNALKNLSSDLKENHTHLRTARQIPSSINNTYSVSDDSCDPEPLAMAEEIITTTEQTQNSPKVSPCHATPPSLSIVGKSTPDTPKTQMLYQCTRELRGLRAQLDTERFEKNQLEEQIMDNEKLILKLTADNALKKKQLIQLKTALEEDEHSNSVSSESVDVDRIKNDLLKEVKRKEASLKEANDKLGSACYEKVEIAEKFKKSEDKLKICMNRISELEYDIEMLKDALKVKSDEYNALETEKFELEKWAQETRESMQSKREVLNSSSDLLNTSLSHSSMNTTPESLATTVIDKQLLEQKRENQLLQEELEVMKKAKSEMGKKLCVLIRKEAQIYDMKDAQLDIDRDMENLDEQFSLITNYIELVTINYKEQKDNVHNLNLQIKKLREQTVLLLKAEQSLSSKVEKLTVTLDNAIVANDSLERSRKEMENNVSQQEHIITKLRDNNACLQADVEKLLHRLNEKCTQHNEDNAAKCTEIVSLQESLQMAVKETADVLVEKDVMSEQLSELQQRLNNLQNEMDIIMMDHKNKLKSMTSELEEKKCELSVQKISEKMLKDKYDALTQKMNDLQSCSDKTGNYNSLIHQELIQKESKLNELESEITALTNKRVALESRMNLLIKEHDIEMEDIQKKLAHAQSMVANLQDQRSREKLLRDKYENCRFQLVTLTDRMAQLFELVDTNIWEEVIRQIEAWAKGNQAIQSRCESLKTSNASNTNKFEDLSVRLREFLMMPEPKDSTYEVELKHAEHTAEDVHRAGTISQEKNNSTHQNKSDLSVREKDVQGKLLKSESEFNKKMFELAKYLQVECERSTRVCAELEDYIEKHYNLQCKYFHIQQQLADRLGMEFNVQHFQKVQMDQFYYRISNLIESGSSGDSWEVDEQKHVHLDENARAHLRIIESRIKDIENMVKNVLDEKNHRINYLTKETQVKDENANDSLERSNASFKEAILFIEDLEKELNMKKLYCLDLEAEKMSLQNTLEVQQAAVIKMVAKLTDEMGIFDDVNTIDENSKDNFKLLSDRLTQLSKEYHKLIAYKKSKENDFNTLFLQYEKLNLSNQQQHAAMKEMEEHLKSETSSSITKLTNQIKHLNETIQNLEHVNENLTAENNKMHMIMSDLEKFITVAKNTELSLKSDLKQHQDIIKDQLLSIEALKTDNVRLHDDNNLLNTKIILLEKDAEQLIEQLKLQSSNIDALVHKSECQVNDLKLLQSKLDESSHAVESKSAIIEELKLSIKEKEKDLNSLRLAENNYEELLAKYYEVNNSKSILESKYNTLNDSMNELCVEKEKQSEQLVILDIELDTLRDSEASLKKVNRELQKGSELLQRTVEDLNETVTKMDRELLEAQDSLKSSALTIGEVNRDKETLKENLAMAKEQLSKMEEVKYEILKEMQSLQELLAASENKLSALEFEKNSRNERILKLEKVRDNQEKIIKELNLQISTIEMEKVKVILENGGLNSEIAQYKERELKYKKMSDTSDATELKSLRLINSKLNKHVESLEAENKALSLDNDNLRAERSQQEAELESLKTFNEESVKEKVEAIEISTSLRLINSKLNERVESLEKLQNELSLNLTVERAQQEELKLFKAMHEQAEHTHGMHLKHAKDQLKERDCIIKGLRKELDAQNNAYESQHLELSEKNAELDLLRSNTDERLDSYVKKLDTLEMQLTESNYELRELRSKHNALLELYNKGSNEKANAESENTVKIEETMRMFNEERLKVQKSQLDCQILQAKYNEAKEEVGRSEERLKAQRLEMEGKLEKMKAKMKTLYNEENQRVRAKHEREISTIKGELESLKTQNVKYEEHTRKLSLQIVRLNDKILEHQKQETLLGTKLRHLQTKTESVAQMQPFKRPSIVQGKPSSGGGLGVKSASVNMGSNLAMEDEEGEVFNNTYLTDLKLGLGSTDMTEELQYRNSLQPPHLKSAYAAQYDLNAHEDDLKDGPHSLDDSMSALLSTTSSCGSRGNSNVGLRKKIVGTHYKRPGPPTPSKNGGRLSLGGSSEPAREILRETCDTGGNAGSAKTPACFRNFASRLSLGGKGGGSNGGIQTRDENSPPKRRLSNMFKRK